MRNVLLLSLLVPVFWLSSFLSSSLKLTGLTDLRSTREQHHNAIIFFSDSDFWLVHAPLTLTIEQHSLASEAAELSHFIDETRIDLITQFYISRVIDVGKHGENFCVKRLTLPNLRPAISGSGYWMQMHGKSSSIYRMRNLDMPIKGFLWKMLSNYRFNAWKPISNWK